MKATNPSFGGSIPRHYEDGLGPLLFDWSADELAGRIPARPAGRILEIACGTGISTEALRGTLPADVAIVATDVNEPMLELARSRRGALPNVEYRVADAQELPFEPASFDAVACQFGLMFFPDKLGALREARRVLRPGGQLVLSVWDSLDANPSARIAQETIASFFETEPPRFLEVPFGYNDAEEIERLISEAGFEGFALDWVDRDVELPSALGPARGYVLGNPSIDEISARGGVAPGCVVEAVRQALAVAFGDAPLRTPLRAAFVTARRPLN